MSVMMITALPNKMAGRGHLAWPALGARNAPTRAMAAPPSTRQDDISKGDPSKDAGRR